MSGIRVVGDRIESSGAMLSPSEARSLAADLLHAADVAEGREDPYAIYSRECAVGLWGCYDASAKLMHWLLAWASDPKGVGKLKRPEVIRAIEELGAEMDLVERFKRRGTRR